MQGKENPITSGVRTVLNGGRSFCLPRSAPIRGKECVFQAPFLSSQRKAEKANSAIQAASPQIPTTNLSHFSNAMMRKLSGMSLMSKSSLFSLGAPSPQYRDRSRRPPKANAPLTFSIIIVFQEPGRANAPPDPKRGHPLFADGLSLGIPGQLQAVSVNRPERLFHLA